MNSTQIANKLIAPLKGSLCTKHACRSEQKDPVELVWFGEQYEQKQITCSACFICNDEGVKSSLPTHKNILPISLFMRKFAEEMKKYQNMKNSKDWFGKVMKERAQEMETEMAKVETDVNNALELLHKALVEFIKKIEEATVGIHKNQHFDQLIEMNNQDKFEQLLEKILSLIQLLNAIPEKEILNYKFEDVALKDKKIEKLQAKITHISSKTLQVLRELFNEIKQKNQSISKL